MLQDYVVLDLETTGLSPKTDRIIEIGAARVRQGKIEQVYTTFVNPGRELTEHTKELTGIKDEDLENAPVIEDVIIDFLGFAGEDCLLGHKILFDYSFIKKAAVNQKLSFEKDGIDTLKIYSNGTTIKLIVKWENTLHAIVFDTNNRLYIQTSTDSGSTWKTIREI